MRSFLALALLLASVEAVASELGQSWFQIEPFKPTYFLLGKPDTKVQFSFKLRFVPTVPIYFAYSQLMKWEIFLPSAPLRDVNYEPELFYRWDLVHEDATTRRLLPPRFVDFGIFAHESNGRDDIDSRSWDRVYLRYVTGWRVGEQTNLVVTGRINVPLRVDPATPDLLWYRGVLEGEVALVRFWNETFEESELRLRVFSAGPSHLNPLEGGQELTLRLKPRASTFLPTFVVQGFHGYSENLLDYSRKRFVFRVGVGF